MVIKPAGSCRAGFCGCVEYRYEEISIRLREIIETLANILPYYLLYTVRDFRGAINMEALYWGCLIGGVIFAIVTVVLGDILSSALDGLLDFCQLIFQSGCDRWRSHRIWRYRNHADKIHGIGGRCPCNAVYLSGYRHFDSRLFRVRETDGEQRELDGLLHQGAGWDDRRCHRTASCRRIR